MSAWADQVIQFQEKVATKKECYFYDNKQA